jgi:hypothetical protein
MMSPEPALGLVPARTVATVTLVVSATRTTLVCGARSVTGMTTTAQIEELISRESGPIEVSLLWSRGDGALSVVVRDRATGEGFSLVPTGPGEVMDVFLHPFAYRASRGAASTFAISGP